MYQRILLFLVMLPAMALAAGELSADLAASNVVDMGNCGPDEGPFIKNVVVNINNEWDATMVTDYEYYDFFTNTWKSAGRLCTVPPGQLMTCQAGLRTSIGGDGNGTLRHEMLRITGRNERTSETKSKTFEFLLNHYPSDKELARLAELAVARSRLAETNSSINATCDSGICCGLAPEKAALSSAQELLDGSSDLVKSCKLNALYTVIVSATTNLNIANSTSLATCKSTLPTFNTTRAGIDAAAAAVRSGEACRANVIISREKLAQGEQAFANASLAVGRDEYSLASSLLANASRFAVEAENSVGECGGTLWNQTGTDNGTGNGTSMGTIERDSNTTGGVSEYVPAADIAPAGPGSCLGAMMFIGIASLLAAFRKP